MFSLEIWHGIALLLSWSDLERLSFPTLDYLLDQDWFYQEKYALLPHHPHYQLDTLPDWSWREIYPDIEIATQQPYRESEMVTIDCWSRLWHKQTLLDLPPSHTFIDEKHHVMFLANGKDKIHLLYLSLDSELIEAHIFTDGIVFYHTVLTDVIKCYRWLPCHCCPMEELICLTVQGEMYYIFRSSPYYEIPYTTHPASLGYITSIEDDWMIEIMQEVWCKTIRVISKDQMLEAKIDYLTTGEVVIEPLK